MSKHTCKKKFNIWYLQILIALSLSGCGFPIRGFSNLHMGVDILNGFFRIFASIVVYAILLTVLTTIPFYIKKSFENITLYKYYKLFWWVASLVFANLLLLLFNVEPTLPTQNEEYISFMLALIIAILLPTLLPATYQHYKRRTK